MWHQQVKDLCEQFPHPAWGPGHARRVLTLADTIAVIEHLDVDMDVLYAAAYLHDLGTFEPYRVEGADHADTSAEVAEAVLAEYDFPNDKIPLVLDVIRGHMFYATPAESNEAHVFHDADVLEFLGAIGIARVLSIVGTDDWTPDLPAAIALLRRFAGELPGRLVTDTAMDKAEPRVALMIEFLNRLGDAE